MSKFHHACVLATFVASMASAGAWAQDAAQSGQTASGNEPTTVGAEGGLGYKATWPDKDTAWIDTKGFGLASGNGDVKFRIGGRIDEDFGTARVRDFRFTRPYNDSLDYRRTWLELYLTLQNSVEFAFQYDFSDPTRPINDAAIAYRGFDPFVFTLGNFKEPFSLNQLISDTNTLFTERSLADAFAPARNFGFNIGTHGEAWTFNAGVFGGNANTGVTENGIAGTSRLTYAPILKPDEVLHLGLAGSYRALDSTGQTLSFSARPESFLFRTALVNTGTLARADAVERIGIEGAYQTGPVRFQGEYIWTGVQRGTGQPDVGFNGGYIEAGWTINGNGRPYTIAPTYGTSYAVFSAPKIADSQRVLRGGIGLFELGARVSYIDLTDRNISGGREIDYTLGINWYPETNVKFVADYVRATAYRSPAASRRVDADIFVGRAQISW